MGALAMSAVAKKGKDKITSTYKSLLQIPTIDIDSNPVSEIGSLCPGKKCLLIVNVATKVNYLMKLIIYIVRTD